MLKECVVDVGWRRRVSVASSHALSTVQSKTMLFPVSGVVDLQSSNCGIGGTYIKVTFIAGPSVFCAWLVSRILMDSEDIKLCVCVGLDDLGCPRKNKCG